MNRLANSLLPTALFLLVFASSIALIAAAWLLATFCLNAVNRFTLPFGLFGLLLLSSVSPTSAQTKTPGDYIVVYERPVQSRIMLEKHVQVLADTSNRTPSINSKKYGRKINAVPAWPDEIATDKRLTDSADIQLFLLVPLMQAGSPEVKGLYGILIRGTR